MPQRSRTRRPLLVKPPPSPSAEAFERGILVKSNAAALLARLLARSSLRDEWLMIGSATDPYQPAERTHRITRALLDTFLPYRDLKIGLITKSPLIARDTELLAQLRDGTASLSRFRWRRSTRRCSGAWNRERRCLTRGFAR